MRLLTPGEWIALAAVAAAVFAPIETALIAMVASTLRGIRAELRTLAVQQAADRRRIDRLELIGDLRARRRDRDRNGARERESDLT